MKQVEAERLHFVESEAEEVHGPLYSVPATPSAEEAEPQEGAVLSPEMPIRELLEPDRVPRVPPTTAPSGE
jgi:hypothetical protein